MEHIQLKKFELIPGKLYRLKANVPFFRYPYIDENSSLEQLEMYLGDIIFLLTVETKIELHTSWIHKGKTIFQEFILKTDTMEKQLELI